MLQDANVLDLHKLFQRETSANPYLLHHQLRTEAPVCWDERQQAWLLTCYADILEVLLDARFSSVLFPSPEDVEPEETRLVDYLSK